MSVGDKCIMYIFICIVVHDLNLVVLVLSFCVGFYTRHTHSMSMLRRHDGYSSTRAGGGWSSAAAPGRRDKEATN